MPRTGSIQNVFSHFTLPSVKNYIMLSGILFFSGFYYYYSIIQTVMNNSQLKLLDEGQTQEHVENGGEYSALRNFVAILRKHRLLFYVLLNTCCAMVAIIGKTLNNFFFGDLSNQEETFLKKFFRRYFQTKLTFLVFISHHNLLEDILIWTPWLGIQIVCLLILELAALRMANAYNVISRPTVWRRLFAATSTTEISSLCMIIFVIGIRNFVNINYCIFLASDCSILFIQSIYLLCKLYSIHDASANIQNQQRPGGSYYLDLVYGLLRDCLEFANYLHIIFYSQLAITYCCVFLMIQAQHYYGRISTKIRKHWQQREIINHINNSYVQATEEDLLKVQECLICWQPLKSARKLPCSHIFHEHCLRRWLEQDSSCAVCRKSLSLNLNNVRQQQQQQNMARDDVNQAMQSILEIFSPQNRFTRWWTRFFFESMNDEQINAMVTQVSEMFPQVSVELIRQLVATTGSLAVTVETLLEGNVQNNANIANAQQQQAQADAANNNENSSSDESYNTSEEEDSENENEAIVPVNQQQAMMMIAPEQQSISQISSQPNFLIKTRNEWLNQQMEEMLTLNKKKYIQSAKGQDICKSLFPQHS